MLCRRVGGAFGGKSSRQMPPAAAAAVAAARLGRPVRYVLNRNDDMRLNAGTNAQHTRTICSCCCCCCCGRVALMMRYNPNLNDNDVGVASNIFRMQCLNEPLARCCQLLSSLTVSFKIQLTLALGMALSCGI